MCSAPPRMKRPLTIVTAVCELECFQEAPGRELTLAAGVNSEPYLMDVGRVGLGLTMPPASSEPHASWSTRPPGICLTVPFCPALEALLFLASLTTL